MQFLAHIRLYTLPNPLSNQGRIHRGQGKQGGWEVEGVPPVSSWVLATL